MRRYLIGFFSSLAVSLGLIQLCTALYYRHIIFHDNAISHHRLPNIRAFPPALRCGIVKDWLRRNVRDGDLLIAGDSQPFGFGVPATDIFSARLARLLSARGMRVKNVSLVDGRFDDTRRVLEIAASLHLKPGQIILDINPSHFEATNHPYFHLPEAKCEEISFLKIARETGIFGNLYAGNLKDPWELGKEEREFKELELPRDYYSDASDPAHERNLEGAFSAASALSKGRVTAYITPLAPYRPDPELPNRIIERVLAFCRENKRTCVEIPHHFEKSDFLDIVHLSSAGHEKLAKDLLPLVADE